MKTAGFSLEARGSKPIVRTIQAMIVLLGGQPIAVDGVIGPKTFVAYGSLSAKAKQVIEGLAAFYDFSMSGEYLKYAARGVANKVGVDLTDNAAAVPSSVPAGSDPRDVTMTSSQVSAFRKGLSAAQIRANKTAVSNAIARAGFKGDDNVALVAWIGVESAGTWDPRIREGGAAKGKGGFGFSQWTNTRANALVKYAASKKKSATDMNVQTTFFTSELLDGKVARQFNGGSVLGKPGSWGRDKLVAALASATTLEKKTFVWQQYFFRPLVQSQAKADAAVAAYV